MREVIVMAFVVGGLLSPFILMIWLTRARKKAQAATASGREDILPVRTKEAFDDFGEEQGGLVMGQHHYADSDVLPPDTDSGDVGAIRGLNTRR